MKSIRNQIKATVAVVAFSSMASLINAPNADAASFELDWRGDKGYSAKGQFSYDDNLLGSIVTKEQLTNFGISFFNPQGTLLQTFNYDFPQSDSSFNFNFDPVTKTVLQTGSFDATNGFDLGIDFATDVTGLDFYTYLNAEQGLPTAKIFLKDDLSPEVCNTYPDCRLDLGGKLTATAIPEPGAIFGLLVLSLMNRVVKKKPAST
ncbi:PEP-CTERM sorting domain-containing protein [Nostoc sp. 'Peltigera membranacea cyanobiont' 213]|uniref:PEP-CTERM sorting domain-containing protein n=1 Tax=Nostoc sp. 'Peltigera membranacea cyanobiont' 213 TaxID=2014530 RepID=UPI000B953959|nr:PEP-CTERM sorting domain-containing protein [Nostoc sp. 'Peltigera membranacea cyanobiont' 213]OYD87005.1 PEP-CTERM sorting domain-containing protein [Nostoc sp. 'Peltigera membranacea cyanobiont' 213]